MYWKTAKVPGPGICAVQDVRAHTYVLCWWTEADDGGGKEGEDLISLGGSHAVWVGASFLPSHGSWPLASARHARYRASGSRVVTHHRGATERTLNDV